MKRCPTCDKTFDDNLKFCQTDGTPLVDDAPEPVDPYKTMVGSKEDIAAAMASIKADAEKPAEPDEQVLDMPEPVDANKTQVVSEAELRAEMERMGAAEEPLIDVPAEPQAPEPPKFTEPEPEPPKFGASETEDRFAKTGPPIPSPFGESKPPSMEPATPFEPEEAPEPEFVPEQEPAFGSTPASPFAEPESPAPFTADEPAVGLNEPSSQAEWNPPAVEPQNMQNQDNFGQNAPAAGPKVNQTLPIVSLVTGILSLCCYIAPLTGLVALITGFLGIKNANNDPGNYGGKTLAIVGMILGGLFFLIGVVYYIFILFLGGMEMMMQMANQA